MKKQRGFGDGFFFLVIALVVIVAIASCSEKKPVVDGETISPTSMMNNRELQILDIYADSTKGASEYPLRVRNDLLEVAGRRTTKPNNGFFCDARDVVIAGDYRVKEFNQNKGGKFKSPSQIFEEVYGVTVPASCGIVVIGGAKKPNKPETPKDFKENQEVVRGNKLTPEMYDRMIESANYCARSKAYMMEATKNKGTLTADDYDGLMDAVLECKRFELEQTLQQK